MVYLYSPVRNLSIKMAFPKLAIDWKDFCAPPLNPSLEHDLFDDNGKTFLGRIDCEDVIIGSSST
jgi:hypothetical protein